MSTPFPYNIYQKYGGEKFFHDIIYDLYLELFDHPEISYHFIGVDIERLSRLQTQYLCQAIGAGEIYQGADIVPVHAHMKITPFQFNVVAKRFSQIFVEHGLTKEEVNFIMTFISSKKGSIVTAKEAMIDKVMRPIYKVIYWLREKIAVLKSEPQNNKNA